MVADPAEPGLAARAENTVVVRERVRIAPAAIVRGVLLTVLALVTFTLLARAAQVIQWVITAAVVAWMLEPVVAWLGRRMRRGLAVLVVALVTATLLGGVVYGVVDGVRRAAGTVEEAVPDRIRDLEDSERFGEFVRDAELVERSERLVQDLPVRLFGTTPSGAVRAAVERVLSFLVVTVLTLFFLSRGPNLARAVRRFPLDEHHRTVLAQSVTAARREGLGYFTRRMTMAGAAGFLAYGLGHLAGVPGAAAVGVWAALWDLVPVVGTVVGFAPLLLLADEWGARTIAAVVVLVLYQVAEVVLHRRWVERGTTRPGPFLTTVSLFAGLEIGGVLGAVVSLAIMSFVVALVEHAVPALQQARP